MANYTLLTAERKDADRWKKRHRKNCPAANFRYYFKETGIGTYVEIHCTKCRKNKNITDYSSW